MSEPDYFLDITDYVCPMTFVKTTLFLESMEPGKTVAVRLNAGEPLENVPRAARDHGHEVLDISPEHNEQLQGVHIVLVQKRGGDLRS
ncbi:MAG: sulfurtransferase TusA family protein [Sphingomonadales bacterium]